MNKNKVLVLVFLFAFSISFVIGKSGTFDDVDSEVWYANAVEKMAEIGIINGYEDGSFKPGNNLNRAEAATMFFQMDKIITGKNAEIGEEIYNLKKRVEDLENKSLKTTGSKNIKIDLYTEKSSPEGYKPFIAGDKNINFRFIVQYPDNLFKKEYNSVGNYNYLIRFSNSDFEKMEDGDISKNTRFLLSIVDNDKKENLNKYEVQFFIEIDDKISFALEGNTKDISLLEDIAKTIQIYKEEEEEEEKEEKEEETETITEVNIKEIDLTKEKDKIDDYLEYENDKKNFKVQYPKNLFYSDRSSHRKEDGYDFYLAFSDEDFEQMEEGTEDEKTNLSLSIITGTKKENLKSEFQIYVKKNDKESFLLEGKNADKEKIEKIADSLENI